MRTLHIKKGFHPRLPAYTETPLIKLPRPSHLALVPSSIPLIKPRLEVKENEEVALGSLIFKDKRRPELRFLSPGGGIVESIKFGPRRSIEAVIIKLSEKEERKLFHIYDEEELEKTDREKLISALLEGGLWPLFKSLPFRSIADPKEEPSALYVNMLCHQAFAPRPSLYLENNLHAFRFAVKVLKKIVPNLIIYTCKEEDTFLINECQGLLSHTIVGKYPAHDPGVLHYHLKGKSPAWYISGQDLLLISHLLETGTYPGERVYRTAGSGIENPSHLLTRFGAPVAHLLSALKLKEGEYRSISGGIFTGRKNSEDGYMGMYESSLARIPEGNKKEFFGFLRLGFKKASYSKTFISALASSPLPSDCNTHGEERACINCGSCAKICPVDILPQFTMKALYADDMEEALSHGLLDCVECGLCSYACPSKVELSSIFAEARSKLYQEQQKEI